LSPLIPCAATPAYVFPDKIAVVHGERRTTDREFEQRLNWLTSALRAAGIQPDESGPVLRTQPPGIAGDPWSPEFDADLIRLRTKKGMRIAYAKGRLRASDASPTAPGSLLTGE